MRQVIAWLCCALALCLQAGCGDDGGGGDASGMDAGRDAATVDGGDDGAVPDGGLDGAFDGGLDGGFDAAFDGGFDSGMDAGPEGCDPGLGIECDGDWEGRCMPACEATECCSPVMGSFSCVPRDGEGLCPAADIWVDESRITDLYSVEWREFPEDHCAIAEGCVGGPGWRRLLRFGTWTPNTGTADLFLGPPGDTSPIFDYSACHDHYHFSSYARYGLVDDEGGVVATGHKQAFCLLDFFHYPGTDGRGGVYSCSNQGIQMGWQDVYGESLDCQWVDVTDVTPGDYNLRIELNYEHRLLESDYTNNAIDVPVTIPPDTDPDVTVECPAGTGRGATRDCSLTRAGSYTCTAGSTVTVACSATCGLGMCTGDVVMRVCEAADDPTCSARHAIAVNDDSGCGSGSCGRGGDCCPQVMFTCPADGAYVVFYGPYEPGRSVTCTVASR